METQTLKKMATLAVAPKLVSKGKFKWIVLAAGVYYGIKYLSKKGVLPEPAESALKHVDAMIDDVQENLGFAKH